MATQQPFTIAISGCSSAGKSTLAFLLAEIFSDVKTDDEVKIIHGDEFFMPKHLCPLITFTSTPADTTFCQATLKDDEIGEYIIAWNGTRGNDAFMTHIPPTSTNVPSYAGSIASQSSNDPENNGVGIRLPSNDSIQTTFSVASTLHEGGCTKLFTISGPDTDCDKAVNFVRMFQALKDISKGEVENVEKGLRTLNLEHDATETKSETDSDGGAPLISPISEHSEDGGVPLYEKKEDIEDLAPPHPHLNVDVPALKAQHAKLITSMKLKVREFLEQSTRTCKTNIALPKIQIIESFLLFSSPSTISPGDSNPNITRLLGVFHNFLQKLQHLSTRLEEKGGVDSDLEEEREAIEKNIQTINGVCKRGIMEHFSCKLWLSTSLSAAQDRRFNRIAYLDRDAREGGLREPGQMWKTEGYFDQIAWKNHLDTHEWLIGENESDTPLAGELGGYKDGVHIRAEDLGVEDTVRWAVGAVLEEMGKLLKGKEEEKVGPTCSGCEGCGGKGGDW